MGNTIKLLCILGPLVWMADLLIGLVRGQGSLAQRWKALWNQEHWLVCGWLGKLRETLSTPLFCGLILLWWGWDAVERVCEVFLPPHLLTVLTVGRSVLVALIVVAKILGCTRYSYQQLVPAAAVFALFVKFYAVCAYPPVIRTVFLFLCAKDTKLLKNLWTMFAAALVSYGTTVALALMGFLDVMATTEGGRVRYALGYGSYNALGISTAQLVLLWLCLRYAKLRWWDLLLAAAGVAFIVVVPNSRGSAMLCLIVLIVMLAAKCFPKLAQKRWMPWLAGAVALVPPAFSYFIVWLYNSYQDQSWMKLIDRLFSGRVGFAWVQQYGFEAHLFGEKFGTLHESLLYRVDNAYVYYRFLCGPIMLALFVAGTAWLVWRLVRRGGSDWALAAVVLGYAFYGVMERNFSPSLYTLLLCNVAWGCHSYSQTLMPPAVMSGHDKEEKQ